jgi:hypothetical protein
LHAWFATHNFRQEGFAQQSNQFKKANKEKKIVQFIG